MILLGVQRDIQGLRANILIFFRVRNELLPVSAAQGFGALPVDGTLDQSVLRLGWGDRAIQSPGRDYYIAGQSRVTIAERMSDRGNDQCAADVAPLRCSGSGCSSNIALMEALAVSSAMP